MRGGVGLSGQVTPPAWRPVNSNPTSWTSKVLAAAVTLVVVAGAARVAWEFLRSLVGPLLILVVVVGILSWVIGRHRRW